MDLAATVILYMLLEQHDQHLVICFPLLLSLLCALRCAVSLPAATCSMEWEEPCIAMHHCMTVEIFFFKQAWVCILTVPPSDFPTIGQVYFVASEPLQFLLKEVSVVMQSPSWSL